MEDVNIDQTAGVAAPADNGEGVKPELEVDGQESAEDLAIRLKGLQGTVQKTVEEKKAVEAEKAELEKKLKEYEFEKLSEMEKVQAKLKEAEEKIAATAKENENLAALNKWSAEWDKLKDEFPNAAKLPIIRQKAESNPGALGDPNADTFEGWISSVRKELAETEESFGPQGGGNPDVKKMGNVNAPEPTSGDIYAGLSLKEKAEKMRENIGVSSDWK